MIILYSDILHDRTPSYLKPIIPQAVMQSGVMNAKPGITSIA